MAMAILVASAGSIFAVQEPAVFHGVARSMLKTISLHLNRNNIRAVEVARAASGDFILHAKVNGVGTPMVIDTGATSVVLTYETAKAVGLPIELADFDTEIETAGGRVKAARLTLDRLAVGKLVELSVPALVVPRGQMKTNLLGMSFLNRLESWEVRPDKLLLHGYP
ncbi:MAG: TIGR02281 family clan AA aspartic protease [Bradyrhizobiaceae bacterium]|nr:MAG: TIGR02281 family clan AA aspartic protease [Bradyrhizobiaceae bacterium]